MNLRETREALLAEIAAGRVSLIDGVTHHQPFYSAVPFPCVQRDYDELGQLVARGLVDLQPDGFRLTVAGHKHLATARGHTLANGLRWHRRSPQ